MSYQQRRNTILDLLETHTQLSIAELADACMASPATIRRDLNKMAAAGELARSWGGARRCASPRNKRRALLETIKPSSEQKLIGQAAACFCQARETIFLGSGVTTLAMLPFLAKKRNLYVITNGISQLEQLSRLGINALLLAGFYKSYSRSLVGSETIEMLKKYHFDRAFFSAQGLSRDFQILSGDNYESELKRIAIENSRHSYLLLEDTKFDRTAFYSFTPDHTDRITIICNKPGVVSPSWEHVAQAYCSELSRLSHID